MQAAVYTRISRRTQTSDDTIAEQQRRGLGVVEMKDWTLVRDGGLDTFTDDGTSAYRDDVKREAFERLIAACQRREVDVIVVRDVDRLSRRDRDWGKLDIAGHELRVSEWDGEPMDRLYAGIKAQVAADESRKISKRVKLSEGRRVQAGKPPRGGRRAFGYDRDHEIIEDEAAVIRDAVRRYLPPEPETLPSICRGLHAAGVTTPTGKTWQPSNLRAMMRSPRLAGLRVHRGKTYEGSWAPIVDVETHRKLLTAGGGTAMRQATTWMLNGVIWCGRCGNRLVGNGGGVRRYVCRRRIGKLDQDGNATNCGLAVTADVLESCAWDRALAQAWQVDENDEARSKTLVAAARAALMDAQRRMAKIDERYTTGGLSDDRWVTLGDAAQREVEAARAQLGDAENTRTALPMWWKLLALDEEGADERRRRQAMQGVVRRVTVQPASRPGRFDARRVEVEWR